MLFKTYNLKIATVLTAMILSFAVQANIINLSGSLSAANQNGSDPAQVTDPLGVVPTEASGSIQIHLDTDNNTLDFKLEVEGIARSQLRNFGPNETPIHLHLAENGNFGSIAIDLSLNTTEPDFIDTDQGFRLERKGVSILLEDQGGVLLGMHPGNEQIVEALQSGNIFVLVHSSKDIFTNESGSSPGFPFAEIRGNIMPVSIGWVGGQDIVMLKDATDVTSAVAELISALEQKGFEIPLVIDHSAAAASVDLKLPPNQVVFARPPLLFEQSLLRKGKTIGIDLPLKFLVFKDKGVIKLSVNTMGYLIDRHELSISDFILSITNKQIKQFGTSGDKGHGLVTIQSLQTVDETVQALQDAISVNPAARIPLVLDFSDRHGIQRKSRSPVLVVFGNPDVGTPLMQADPRIGIDLPLKFLVWEDAKGQVNITYNDLYFIARRTNLDSVNERLDNIAQALKNIAEAGAGKNP